MSQQLVISDGDSTLIDTPKFIEVLPRAVEAVFGAQHVLAPVYEAEIRSRQFYAADGAGYDLDAHLAHHHLTLSPTHRARLIETLKSIGQSFVYADVPAFLRQFDGPESPDFAILTRGVHDLQELKLELCANEFKNIPTEITRENKGLLLSKYWGHTLSYRGKSYKSALYIDDNAAELLDAPDMPWLQLYQIVRPQQRYAKSDSPRVTTVESLANIHVKA